MVSEWYTSFEAQRTPVQLLCIDDGVTNVIWLVEPRLVHTRLQTTDLFRVLLWVLAFI